MAKPEYDGFYYNGTTIELKDALNEEMTDLLDMYNKDQLYCPECNIARLRFTQSTHARNAFLSTWPPSAEDANNHNEVCPHRLKRATKSQTRKHYDSLTDEQIEDKLNAAINMYLRRHDANTANNLPLNREENPGIAVITEDNHRIYRRLPKRSIYSIYNIKEDELNIPILLYGTVRLTAEERPSQHKIDSAYYVLHVISIKTGHTIRRFNLNTLPAPIDPDSIYYLTMIIIASKYMDKVSFKLYRTNPGSLLYIEEYTQ